VLSPSEQRGSVVYILRSVMRFSNSLISALRRGQSFKTTNLRLSSHKPPSPSSSSIPSSERLNGHLKESTKYVAGTFISSFADSLAFYLVAFSAVGVGCYFTYGYVTREMKKPFPKIKDRLEENKKHLNDKVNDVKDHMSGMMDRVKGFKDRLGELNESQIR
jgi:predicted PurR-regulated permease PerM